VNAEIINSSSNKVNGKFSIGLENSHYTEKIKDVTLNNTRIPYPEDRKETVKNNTFYISVEDSLDSDMYLGYYFSFNNSKKMGWSILNNNLYLKYRFNSGSKFRPFFGIGGGYKSMFWDDDATANDIDFITETIGGTAATDGTGSFYADILAGFEYQFSKKFSLEFAARYDITTQKYKQKGSYYNYLHKIDYNVNFESKQLQFNLGIVYSN
jgi:hypothetical protein